MKSISRRDFTMAAASCAAVLSMPIGQAALAAPGFSLTYFDARPGSRSRDLAFDRDGMVWYCGQRDGTLTRLDPADGSLHPVSLGDNAAPHGVTLGPDGAMWVTEGGQNAIARLDPASGDVDLFPLPTEFARANLNTGTFDLDGIYWFTGQNGVYGRVNPATGKLDAWPSPGGPGPYGITVTPGGDIWYASLAGNHIARIDPATGQTTRVDPPTPRQGARRVWTDSRGRLWISEWNSGQVSVYDPAEESWQQWKLPGTEPRAYAVYVDERDKVWLTDFGANAIVMFDPESESFSSFPSDRAGANVRHLTGRAGEVWGGESGNDRIVRIRFGDAA